MEVKCIMDMEKKIHNSKTYFLGDIENGYITANGKFYDIYDYKLIS